MGPTNTPVRRLQPVYGPPSPDGVILVYSGDLLISADDGRSWTVPGDIRLCLRGRTEVSAEVAGTDAWMADAQWSPDQFNVAMPPAANLGPPLRSAVPVKPEGATQWAVVDNFLINSMAGGDLASAERLVIHLTGSVGNHLWWPRVETDDGPQDQLSFDLPGWTLRMAAVAQQDRGDQFSYVIEALPHPRMTITENSVHDLTRRIFVLLSFIRGTTIGVGPCTGVDAAGSIIWAEWTAPRVGSTYSRHRWCWDRLVGTALPALSVGIAQLPASTVKPQAKKRTPRRKSQVSAIMGFERCIHRAIALQLAANNGEVELDVRIPLACAGLELLGWSVLQHRGWLTTASYGSLSAAGVLRLLLQYAGIPVELPTHHIGLLARRDKLLRPDDAGPEVLFDVRNKLLHPPNSLDDPEWPEKELPEAWDLATWYLELVILRVLGYDGAYVSRLRLTGLVSDTEQVPWNSHPVGPGRAQESPRCLRQESRHKIPESRLPDQT